ncbi:MAG: hypothetical protein JST59_02140 [Actinobacteria bacterium]|nr:hypothetical protein [Actinomycetota bacterium]
MISDKCPNGHKTTWTGEKIKCAHCDTVRTGWKCAKCNYNLCDGCAEKGLITLVQEEDGKHCCSMM